MDKWQELKEHCEKQKERYNKLESGGAIRGLGTHIWQDVLNKMWSLENKRIKKEIKSYA